MADTLTGERRQYTTPPMKSYGDYAAAFSPNGKQLAFQRCAVGACDIFVLPAGGGNMRQLTNQHVAIAGFTWRPDSQAIVFSFRRRGQYELWQFSLRGAGEPELIPVADEEAIFPHYGRRPGGGLRLLYEQHLSDSNIWRLDLDPAATGALAVRGEPRRLIASTRLDNSPQVSPDGKKIAFVSTRSGFDKVGTVDANGGNAAQVTQLRAELGSPRWSPDSNRITFNVVTEEGRAVFIVDASGGAAASGNRTRGLAVQPSPVESEWNVDSVQLVFQDALEHACGARTSQHGHSAFASCSSVYDMSKIGLFERAIMARSGTERQAMVRTISLNAEIPASRELHITLPADFPIGPVDMVLVISSPAPAETGTLGDFLKSEFFGVWADRTDIEDSAQFARHLRTEGWKRSA